MSDFAEGVALVDTAQVAEPMFETGREYEIRILEDTSDGTVESYSTYEVLDWQPPLLKVKQFSRENIFNTASPYFVRAEKRLQDDEKKPSIFDQPTDGPQDDQTSQALRVVELAFAAIERSGASFEQEGPRRIVYAKVGSLLISYREPFVGGTFGPDYRLDVRQDRELVMRVEWYEEGGDKDVVNFHPGDWMKVLDGSATDFALSNNDDLPY